MLMFRVKAMVCRMMAMQRQGCANVLSHVGHGGLYSMWAWLLTPYWSHKVGVVTSMGHGCISSSPQEVTQLCE